MGTHWAATHPTLSLASNHPPSAVFSQSQILELTHGCTEAQATGLLRSRQRALRLPLASASTDLTSSHRDSTCFISPVLTWGILVCLWGCQILDPAPHPGGSCSAAESVSAPFTGPWYVRGATQLMKQERTTAQYDLRDAPPCRERCLCSATCCMVRWSTLPHTIPGTAVCSPLL